jgi:hypothetical protein
MLIKLGRYWSERGAFGTCPSFYVHGGSLASILGRIRYRAASVDYTLEQMDYVGPTTRAEWIGRGGDQAGKTHSRKKMGGYLGRYN